MLTVSQANTNLRYAPGRNQQIHPLDDEHKEEVLSFLAARPLHTFIMRSWIQDNGIVSKHNRGSFYGFRNSLDQLEGVALIGHITLFETKSDGAIATFAYLASNSPWAHAVLGEEMKAHRFLKHYTQRAAEPRLICRELLFEKQATAAVDSVSSLRRATSDELDLIVPIHAQTAFEESGINPLDVNPSGFRQRCARRIEQGRVWVALENERLKFKADVVSDTPEVNYLEGVYVSPEHRGNGYGSRCLTQLTNTLLTNTGSVCLLVNQNNAAAKACYQKAGYKFREYYDTLYLQQLSRDEEASS